MCQMSTKVRLCLLSLQTIDEFPLYRLVNDSQEILHFRQCLRSMGSSSVAATAKAEKYQAFQSPNAAFSAVSSPSLLRQRSVSKVGRLPGEDTVLDGMNPTIGFSKGYYAAPGFEHFHAVGTQRGTCTSTKSVLNQN